MDDVLDGRNEQIMHFIKNIILTSACSTQEQSDVEVREQQEEVGNNPC